MIEADVVVVGAGPAGCTAAMALGRLDKSVVLVGPGAPRRSGLRIETMAESADALARGVGLASVVERSTIGPVVCRQLRWLDRSDDAGEGNGARLLDRSQFDRLIHTHAASSPYVRSIESRATTIALGGDRWFVSTVSGDAVRARFLVEARGGADVGPRRALGPRRVAVSAAVAPFANGVTRVEAMADAWVWCASGSDRAMVQVIVDPAAVAGLDRFGRTVWLRNALASSTWTDEMRLAEDSAPTVVVATASASDEVVTPNRLRIGDSALRYDPVSGQGLAHALRSGAQAAPVVATLTDPDGDHVAGRAFAHRHHCAAVEAHIVAIQSTYPAAAQRPEPFWNEYLSTDAPPSPRSAQLPTAAVHPTANYLLSPDACFVSEPVLDRDRVVTAPALMHPGLDRPVAFVNGTAIGPLVDDLRLPGTFDSLVNRLTERLGPTGAQSFVAALQRVGALVEQPAGPG